MKKIISFEKKIEFPSMIGEITSISLDHTLKFVDNYNVEGEFIVSGTYKLTEASRIEEEFKYELPAAIILGEKLDLSTAKVEIDDFYYEIENDYTLISYIDVKVEGVEEIEIEEEQEVEIKDIHVKQQEPKEIENLEETILKIEEIEKLPEELVRECDGDINDDNYEMEKEEMVEEKQTQENNVSSLFANINESEETYSTYSVYILREEETINSLIEKYKTTKEELENYNDLSNITIGSKIIIPLHEDK